MKESITFFATCPKGLEDLLFSEISDLGGDLPKQTVSGVAFKGTLETAYRICLWSRLANRVLMPLALFKADTPDVLYEQVYSSVNWNEHMKVNGTLAVDFSASGNNRFHTHYAALRVKDAVVDQFMAACGARPSVDRVKPDIRINVYMKHDQTTLSLDLSGESLHKRGYRMVSGPAPLKENLAAGILIRAGWPKMVGIRAPLVDPMCGSGTLLIEGAMMAFDMAPGSFREYFGFLGWNGHQKNIWRDLCNEAGERANEGRRMKAQFYGFDADKAVLRYAAENAARMNLDGCIRLIKQDILNLKAPGGASGLMVVNPPYGARMGEINTLEILYRNLGAQLRQEFTGWNAGVFTGNPDLAKLMRIRAVKYYHFFNGTLPCKLLNFEISDKWMMQKQLAHKPISDKSRFPVQDSGGEMFANRIKKNLKNIGKWAQKEGIECYRLYDADMPEYAVAVDIYKDWAHVQEYEAPKGVAPKGAERRLSQVMAVLHGLLGFSSEKVILKVRKKTRGKDQYEKYGSSGNIFFVRENNLKFYVNLVDYLDTGLFLDQRLLRKRVRDLSSGKRLLNLFCYTASASVYGIAGGAVQTTSVDMSRTYLRWAEKNFELNGFKAPRHEMIQADCLEWIRTCRDQYDLIFLSPPTFSNSKRMRDSFDIQQDHFELIRQVTGLLSVDGLLLFSSNRRKFRMDRRVSDQWHVKDISSETIPKDFKRRLNYYHCYEIKG